MKMRGCLENSGKHAAVHHGLKTCANAPHDPAPDVIEDTHHPIKECDQYRERDQRLKAARAQDTVVYVQHIERPSEHQHVHKEAEKGHDPIKSTALFAGFDKFGFALGGYFV